MQDAADETEPDLQSVFNKISESLKTINQETKEVEGENAGRSVDATCDQSFGKETENNINPEIELEKKHEESDKSDLPAEPDIEEVSKNEENILNVREDTEENGKTSDEKTAMQTNTENKNCDTGKDGSEPEIILSENESIGATESQKNEENDKSIDDVAESNKTTALDETVFSSEKSSAQSKNGEPHSIDEEKPISEKKKDLDTENVSDSSKNLNDQTLVINLDDSDEETDKRKVDKNTEKATEVGTNKETSKPTDITESKIEVTNVGVNENEQKNSDLEIIDLDDDDSNDGKSLQIDEERIDSPKNEENQKVEQPTEEVNKNTGDPKSISETEPLVQDLENAKGSEKMDLINADEQENQEKTKEKTPDESHSSNITSESVPSAEPAKTIELSELEKPQTPQEKYIFHNKECVNYECSRSCQLFYLAPIFVLNYYRVTIKSNLSQFVCDDCYEAVVDKYEEWCNLLENHQPLLLAKVPQKTNEFVEILDSSDEDDEATKNNQGVGDIDAKSVDLIQKELDDVISTVLQRTEIQNQLTWSKTLLEHRIAKIKEQSDWINDTLTDLQKNADKMNNTLYQCPKIEMKNLCSLDLNSGKPYVLGESTQANQFTIPQMGEISRPPIIKGGEYFAAKNKVIASWLPCEVVEFTDPVSNDKQRSYRFYKVKFFKMKLPTYKLVPAKHLAYAEVPKVQLSIGTRVIALFDASSLYKTKEYRGPDIKSAFYPGVIAEALQPYNNYRYLIFFDDGYTQYVHHRDVRLICEVSVNVWDDIHPGSRDFIQNYLINYKKNRPMVQVKRGQSMVTELNGKWIYAKVVDVDASLIQMLFEGQKNHTEWIYRGSTRLGPLFKAIQKTNIPQVTRLPRRSEPFVRYMQDDENAKQQQQAQTSQSETNQGAPQIRSQVARKSTARQEVMDVQAPPTTVKHLNNSTIFVDDEEPKGTLIYYSSKSENNPPPRSFKPHMCGPHCIFREHFEGHYGVLSKPLLNSWERSIYKIKNKKTSVVYRSPCGRNLRSIDEVHRYLRLTRNELNVENFVFDPDVGCLNEYQVKKCIVNKSDITEGREKIPIQCVNYYDHTMPPECEYSADRIPTEGVNLITDPEFLVGCDCKDDCTDKSKCSCWKLTLEGARFSNPHTPIENIGYSYKRLLEPVTTGIYECNSRCKCYKNCINRVVQHPLETKLQVFKTSNRGWGLRCINDVPKGAFICIYAGNLLTEQKANECGDGDEYFAELDYIEVAERLKEGYESDVQEDVDSDEYVPEQDSDEEFNPRTTENSETQLINTRKRTASANRSNSNTTTGTNDDDDEQERQTINFLPNTQMENYEEITTKYKSMRRCFGKNEYCYIMDAKSIGNVGRYFNHSCAPNLFVQNVFVDTHDLRFPWVAFFALTNIRAGTELTWNYNYEVGVVPGKVLFCQCGAANCRGRLL